MKLKCRINITVLQTMLDGVSELICVKGLFLDKRFF
jgi:hypothetical protein